MIYFKCNENSVKKIILSLMIFISDSFCRSWGLVRNVFIFCHGSRPAPEGNASGGSLRSEDRVPWDRLMTSFAKTATETALSLSHLLTSCAIDTGVTSTSSCFPSFLPVSPTCGTVNSVKQWVNWSNSGQYFNCNLENEDVILQNLDACILNLSCEFA